MERVETMYLLFQKTSQRFYYFGQNEKTILLFGVGRVYEFTDEEKESGGTGVIRSDDPVLPVFFSLNPHS